MRSINKSMENETDRHVLPTLLIVYNWRTPTIVQLKGNMSLGRDFYGSENDIRIPSSIVSRNHGQLLVDESDGGYFYRDLNSKNGTYVNGRKLLVENELGSSLHKLSNGDIIRIDGNNLKKPRNGAVLMIYSTSFNKIEQWKWYDLSNKRNVFIGRDRRCSLRLNDGMTSRIHAKMSGINGMWYIMPNEEDAIVAINGKEIDEATRLYIYDVINIADTTFIFAGDSIMYNSASDRHVSLDVNIKDKTNSGKTIIKDIKVNFQGGDFVLILGGSGAGKSTLIKAINGEDKANGTVKLNGCDFYKKFERMKSQIGTVSQFTQFRETDTVFNVLMDTAYIALGNLYSEKELLNQVVEVIDTVGIKELKDNMIGTLSGGQRKKLSVAKEIIGFQKKVLICDEPDSGLDRSTRAAQMELLKRLSEEGRIVIVVSHQSDDAIRLDIEQWESLFTKVVVIAKSQRDGIGHLVFFGNVEDTLAFFGVDRLEDIMFKINPKSDRGNGEADKFIRKYNEIRRD